MNLLLFRGKLGRQGSNFCKILLLSSKANIKLEFLYFIFFLLKSCIKQKLNKSEKTDHFC